ncbi:MAG TPA: GNAT family N-acetyltransferase, partial [Pyrinomonadaceae bacterium]|nr:GNAT family N-acetyltransferase [Pyrinomonadaceae bacterium]
RTRENCLGKRHRRRSPITAMHSVETARLYLRMFRPDDLDSLAALLADRDVMRYVGDGQPASRKVVDLALKSIIRHWEDHGFGRWAAIDKETQTFIGFGGLRSLMGTPEVVYHFAKSHWARGLATELAKAGLRYGFEEHHFDRILAVAKPENVASIHVMEKLGMRYDKLTSYYNIEVVQYEIGRAEFDVDDSPYLLRRS